MGFSKGGVVLNQLLTELSELHRPTAWAPGGGKPARAAPPRFDAAPAAPAASKAVESPASDPQPVAAAPAEAAALLRAVASVHFVDAGVNSRGAYLTDLQVSAEVVHMHVASFAGCAGRGTVCRSREAIRKPYCVVQLVMNCIRWSQVAQGLGLAAAAQPRLRVTLHGTPRQWDDPLRTWLAVEKNRCLAALRAADVPVEARPFHHVPACFICS